MYNYRPEPLSKPPVPAQAAGRDRVAKTWTRSACSFRPGRSSSSTPALPAPGLAGNRPQERWTVCSFMALNRDKAAMYCWG